MKAISVRSTRGSKLLKCKIVERRKSWCTHLTVGAVNILQRRQKMAALVSDMIKDACGAGQGCFHCPLRVELDCSIR